MASLVEEDVVDWRGGRPESGADVEEALLRLALGRPGEEDDGAAVPAQHVQGRVEAALNATAPFVQRMDDS